LPSSNPLKCLDCVGENCMGSFCDGEYCMLSRYAPRWGTLEWGEPRVIKGCLSGSLVKKGIRNHCETVGETAGEVSSSFSLTELNLYMYYVLRKHSLASAIRKTIATVTRL
jgi:hypothetical protein